MQIEKIQFINIINDIQSQFNKEEELTDHLNHFVEGIGFATLHTDKWQSIIIGLLEHIFDDELDTDFGGWISYFIYDLEFGSKWTNKSAQRADGSVIDISTAEKLYEFLLENQLELIQKDNENYED